MASTSVVLPWSTWATMATLRRSSRVAAGMAKTLDPLREGTRGVYGRVRGSSHQTTLPSAVGRAPQRAESIATSCSPRPPSSASLALRSLGSGWSASLTPRVTTSSRSSAVSSIGPLACRSAFVTSSLTSSSASSTDRLESPRVERAADPRAGRGDGLEAAVELPGPDPVGAEAGQLGHQESDVVLVPGRPVQGGQDVVAERVEPRWPVLERPAEAAQPVVDVDVTGLDQAIGVEHQPRTVGHLEGDRLERHPADAQRCARRLGQQLGRTVRPLQHRRRVSRRRVGERPGHRVEDRVDAGGQLDLVGVLGEDVEVAEQVLGHRVEHGEHPDRRAQLAHRGGCAQPASHHVTDDQRDPAAGQRDHVEPVTADTQVPAAGEVALGRVDAGHPRLGARQQGALQRDGGGARLVVQADVVQRQCRPGRDLLGQGHVGLRVRRSAAARGPARRRRARDPGPAAARTAGSGRRASALSPRAVPVRSALAAGPPGG